MSGGSWEYVMGVMEESEGSGIPTSGRSVTYNSGFTGNFTCPKCENFNETVTNITGVPFPKDNKYYNLYDYGTSDIGFVSYKRGLIGDCTYELGNFSSKTFTVSGTSVTHYTSSWNNDRVGFVYHGRPWFIRGGLFNYGSATGIFSFYTFLGNDHNNISFRSVLSCKC